MVNMDKIQKRQVKKKKTEIKSLRDVRNAGKKECLRQNSRVKFAFPRVRQVEKKIDMYKV